MVLMLPLEQSALGGADGKETGDLTDIEFKRALTPEEAKQYNQDSQRFGSESVLDKAIVRVGASVSNDSFR